MSEDAASNEDAASIFEGRYMEFYNLKTRQKVEIPETGLRKSTMVQKNGKHTYAVTGEENGTKLFRFISKQQYDALQVPEN